MAKAKKKAPRRTKTPKRQLRIPKSNVFEHLGVKHLRLLDVNAHLEIHDGKIPVKAKIESGATVANGRDRTIHVDVFVNIEGRPKDDDGGNSEGPTSVATISMKYQCIFAIVDETPPESFVEHADQVVRAGMDMAWPYLRETAHTMTLKMGIPPFVIPPFVPAGRGEHLVSVKSEGPPSQ